MRPVSLLIPVFRTDHTCCTLTVTVLLVATNPGSLPVVTYLPPFVVLPTPTSFIVTPSLDSIISNGYIISVWSITTSIVVSFRPGVDTRVSYTILITHKTSSRLRRGPLVTRFTIIWKLVTSGVRTVHSSTVR